MYSENLFGMLGIEVIVKEIEDAGFIARMVI